MKELQIDLTSILQTIGSELEIELVSDLFRRQKVFDLNSPLEIAIKFTNTGEYIWVRGRVVVPWNFSCARCGRSFQSRITIPLEEQFYRHRPAGLPASERGFVILNDKYVDLTEMLRQNIILEYPDKPICSPDCPPIKYSTGGQSGTILAEKLRSLKVKRNKNNRRNSDASPQETTL